MTEAPADPDQLRADQDRIIDLLGTEWSAIIDLLGGLSAAQWATSVLPGWTVHDVLAHLAGTEYSLAGTPVPEVPAGSDAGSHVHNDIGKLNELWVVALRSRSDAELLADFSEVTAKRLDSLRAMPVADFHAPSWTPAGPGTYGRFMEIRIFDCWMHEQDIRTAVGLPGNESGRPRSVRSTRWSARSGTSSASAARPRTAAQF